MTHDEKARAVRGIALAVLAAIRDAGERGVPGGMIYAALMQHGCSFDGYQTLMGMMVNAGAIERRGECYFAVTGQDASARRTMQ